MMRFSFLLVLLLSVTVTVSAVTDTRSCIQGGAPPAECPDNFHWDSVACRWVCNQPSVPVECVANPCDAAVQSGACSREACIPDYSKGCNFICATPTPPTGVNCIINPCDAAVKSGACSRESCVPDYSKGCNFICNTPAPTSSGVNCIIDPCQNADREGICPKQFCTADYSRGCDFKCSKCTLTCTTVKCAGGEQCTIDQQCQPHCQPIPTTPTCSPVCKASCIEGYECGHDENGCAKCVPSPTPTPTPTPVVDPTPSTCHRDVCLQACIPGYSCQTDSNGCKKCLPTPTSPPTGVKCFIDPCQNADRNGVCPKESCTADYSHGCNFKCSKCTLTCATVKCAGGTECVQDDECKVQCRPAPTATPTSSGPDVCIQGGAPPAECSGPGQYEWDNKACKWICKPTVPVECVANPCDAAVKSGACSREACIPDYSKGCNFICNTPTPPTGVKCIIDPCQNADREGKCPFKYCTADYSKGCDFKCSIPTPTPTPTPTGVNCIINPCENAAREGKCPKEYCTPDYSRGCDFKCSIPTPDPSCPRTCIFNCAIGMACHPDQFGCIRCMKTCTTNQGNTVYQGDQYYQGCASCTCGGVCSHLACQGKCFDDQGKSHNEKDVVPQPDGCNTCSCTGGQWKCTQKNCAPPGSAVVLSASFTLTTAFRTNSRVFTLLHHEASEADVRASFAINKDDITFDSITTNGMYKFNVKCSFKGANDADREASWNAFKRQLRIDGISTSGVTIAAAANGVGSGGTGFIAEDLDTATTTTETMMMQSCENGQDIPAEQQCQDQAMNVPVSGSTSSTPIAIIIGPIVGGIVLLALIATAAIVIARRRTNTVKTMHSAAYDNNMTPNPAVTATDGEQRV